MRDPVVTSLESKLTNKLTQNCFTENIYIYITILRKINIGKVTWVL